MNKFGWMRRRQGKLFAGRPHRRSNPAEVAAILQRVLNGGLPVAPWPRHRGKTPLTRPRSLGALSLWAGALTSPLTHVFSRAAFSVLAALAVFAGFVAAPRARAQTFPTPGYFRHLASPPSGESHLSAVKALSEYAVAGKLRLSLRDAIHLTLLNNTGVAINELQVQTARYTLMNAYSPFDPVATSSFNAEHSLSPAFTQLSGAPTVSSLSQATSLGYTQTFQTGANYNAQFSANKISTNSVFNFFNPSLFSTFTLTLTQPLLRGRGLFANRAPILIAQRGLKQSQAAFQASVNTSIQQAVTAYWGVVQARETLKVLRKSLELAQATHKRNQRALQLGALAPLDIYRSESEVATRRVSVIQQEYTLKQAEDLLRQTIGADLDPYYEALDLDLTENPDPGSALESIDIETALKTALENRPEEEQQRQALVADGYSVRLAQNSLLPNLSLGGIYASNSLAGNELIQNGATLPLLSQTSFATSLGQLLDFKYPTYGFTVTLNLPVRNHAGEAALGTALVQKRHDLYATRQLDEQITLEVRNAVHQLEQAKLALAASNIELETVQKTLQAEQRRYDLGSETIFILLATQTELANAELNLLQSQVGYQLAVTAVDYATGRLPDRYQVHTLSHLP